MNFPRRILLLLFISTSAGAVERELRELVLRPAQGALYFYQHIVSPIKGHTCPMEPSDSAYAKEALRKHGLLLGILQTADRLHRCGHDLDHYPLVETERGLKRRDPVQ